MKTMMTTNDLTNIDTSKVEAMGFSIELTGREFAPFACNGKRGARFWLIQNKGDANLFGVSNMRGSTNLMKGYGWFKIIDGVLTPVR